MRLRERCRGLNRLTPGNSPHARNRDHPTTSRRSQQSAKILNFPPMKLPNDVHRARIEWDRRNFDGKKALQALSALGPIGDRAATACYEHPAMNRPSRISFVSLGCPKALVDSERII